MAGFPAEKRGLRSVVLSHSELSDNPLEGIGLPDFKLPVILLVDVVDVKLMFIVHFRFTFHSYVLHRVDQQQSRPLIVSVLGCGKPLLFRLQIYKKSP